MITSQKEQGLPYPEIMQEGHTIVNVMMTSAGRRVTLLNAFKVAANGRGGRLFAGDMDALAPTLYLADVPVRLPRVTSDDYIPTLLDIVKANGISLIVPTIDTELLPLSRNSSLFAAAGCLALVSSPELVRVCADKWETVRWFREHGFSVPKSWLPEDVRSIMLPRSLFVKPRDGSASQNAFRIDRDSLADMLRRVPNPIIQEELIGAEVTVDLLLDFRGRLLHYVPRLRVRTVGGESVQGVTVSDPAVSKWTCEVAEGVASLGGIGPITIQGFITSHGPVLTEINPRFGGGIPLTLAAGGLYPQWLISMASGEEVAPCVGHYRTNLYMTRYYSEIITSEPLWT